MRKSEIARKTGETEITLQLNLDARGSIRFKPAWAFWTTC